MKKLESVIASVPMFFSEDESLDFNELERYLRIVGVEGHSDLFYPMAYNTRINLMKNHEVIKVNQLVARVAHEFGMMYALCPPYKATNIDVRDFLEYFDATDEYLYGVSLLFPERVYGDFEVIKEYFKVPTDFGMKTLFHEMKYVSGMDGSLNDWSVDDVKLILENCDPRGMKEDSKNDELTAGCLASFDCDVILAGGGLTQAQRFLHLNPKTWLAGVSLVDPTLAATEYKVFQTKNVIGINYFIEQIETPFFALCKEYGWHCVHKALLNHVHSFRLKERSPMPVLAGKSLKKVIEIWDEVIEPAINSFNGAYRS
jgi:dihydrodipicolinate synthase/N-acetylneuraminate lyase